MIETTTLLSRHSFLFWKKKSTEFHILFSKQFEQFKKTTDNSS